MTKPFVICFIRSVYCSYPFSFFIDLVKFLLDTKGFVLVQDMIGIASELPNISTVAESKSDLLPNVVSVLKL